GGFAGAALPVPGGTRGSTVVRGASTTPGFMMTVGSSPLAATGCGAGAVARAPVVMAGAGRGIGGGAGGAAGGRGGAGIRAVGASPGPAAPPPGGGSRAG